MRFGKLSIGMAMVCVLLLAIAAFANEQQSVSPVWGSDDSGDFAPVETYHMVGFDFDADTVGHEIPEELVLGCEIENAGGDMVTVKFSNRIGFRAAATGTMAFKTDTMVIRSQAFPDPFDPDNQDLGGNLLYAYWAMGDVTSDIQAAVTGGADPTDTLCDFFPTFGAFGITMATTATGPTRTLIFAETLLGAYALKTDPANNFYGGEPLEGIGVAKYLAIEASVGSGNKGDLVGSKSFNLQSDFNEATPGWHVDPELSFVGDLLETTDDVIRIVEHQPATNPDRAQRRVRHFDIRTGDLIGDRLVYSILDD